MKEYYVYILTNQGHTTLYIGVTNGLTKRVLQHRLGEHEGFSKRYNTNRLVYFERFADIRQAIAREKQLKRWSRRKKQNLIETKNPDWMDLAVTVLGLDAVADVPWRPGGGWR